VGSEAICEAFIGGRVWKIRRGRWLRDNRPFCRACFGTGRLDVHHYEYVEGQLGNEPDDCLVALCHGRSCHIGGAHFYIDSGRYPSRRAATEAFIRDSRDHRRKVKARRRLVRRVLVRLLHRRKDV
jgi:hypothetical protein